MQIYCHDTLPPTAREQGSEVASLSCRCLGDVNGRAASWGGGASPGVVFPLRTPIVGGPFQEGDRDWTGRFGQEENGVPGEKGAHGAIRSSLSHRRRHFISVAARH